MPKAPVIRTFIGKHSVAQTAIEQAEQAANAAIRSASPDAEITVVQAQTFLVPGTGPASAGINDMFYCFITVTIASD
ncbi:MAG: hypothetical protein KatS3mg057_1257 [Herpetosiphonaceae bacterium]|nr:MAG: hypothetical protein KatS3mg057_1257 [Herpetosiphonaceae bacterium]